MSNKMGGGEIFVYRLFVILTFGGLFIYKLACKKAIEEML